ncbi:hypothetical protein [Bradyrhizobium sp. LTSPM299]|uniref:hypothetical protein n=1 Tax=Bradyrhizobium sp. LTSPM299 TaxID=1619233 RepID=UPI000AD2B94B|nr:hypothetical protein [Bradyrhizobium sp. LTSPM299]
MQSKQGDPVIRKAKATLLAVLVTVSNAEAADNMRRLKGTEIVTTLSGMQFTDEVHWREVYERNGTLRSYSMGRASVGKWRLRKNELCTGYGSEEERCFEVWRHGNRVIMQRDAEDKYPNEGILERPSAPPSDVRKPKPSPAKN